MTREFSGEKKIRRNHEKLSDLSINGEEYPEILDKMLSNLIDITKVSSLWFQLSQVTKMRLILHFDSLMITASPTRRWSRSNYSFSLSHVYFSALCSWSSSCKVGKFEKKLRKFRESSRKIYLNSSECRECVRML